MFSGPGSMHDGLVRALYCDVSDLASAMCMATSHTRLRACDYYTSTTLIGGKGGASSSLLHNTRGGRMEYVNARWMYNLHGFLHGIERIIFHGALD